MSMTSTPTGDHRWTPDQAAEAYASLGWFVVPIAPGKKHPQLPAWQEAATDNLDTIRSWYTGFYKGHGVGVTTGARSGIWVLDIDVANGKQGDQHLADLIAEHGPLPATVEAETGTGGGHLLFRWDPARPVTNGMASRLPPGLDIRGEGGQIVVAPTMHPCGEPYRWLAGRDPWAVEVADGPDWFYQLLAGPAPAEAPGKIAGEYSSRAPAGPGVNLEQGPADWLRQTWDWPAELEAEGWTRHSDHPGESWWTRPGKNTRDGHSAVLHEPDGPLVVFSTEVPAEVWRTGTATRDGSGVSLTPFGFVAGYRHGGDLRAAGQALRAQLLPATAGAGPVDIAPLATTPATRPAPGLNLPAAVWDSRPTLGHIRTAAWARILSPDAVLYAVLARLAAATPPAMRIPPIIGAASSLACYVALTGPPGTGKSTALGAAADLFPIRDTARVASGGQLGSGEGLIELYMGDVKTTDDNGKARTERQQTKFGAFVTLDEGAALAELGQRKGSTVLPILRSMWTGGAVGQSNASATTTRQLKAGAYSLGFAIGLQPSLAGALLSDDAAGTPQRFLWASTTDPAIPSEPVPWPGVLGWRQPSRATGKLTADLDLAPEIVCHIRHAALARNRGEVIIDALDAHADLLRLKVAGLLAILDERLDVTVGDWEMAGVIVTTSAAVRLAVAERVRFEAEQVALAADRSAARRAVASAAATAQHQESEYDRVLDSAARSVARIVAKHGTAVRRDLQAAIGGRRRKITPTDDVIAHSVELGWLLPGEDGTFRPGPVAPGDEGQKDRRT